MRCDAMRGGVCIARSRRTYALLHRPFGEDTDIVLYGAFPKFRNFRADLLFNVPALLSWELPRQAVGHMPDDKFIVKFSIHRQVQ